ncbi:MAG: ATP-dependent helicase, partial [Cytophagaceae bacterium]
MKVSTAEPFQITYSLLQHEYLGYLFETFVVQKDQNDKLTLKHQNISSKNAEEFSDGLDDADFQLIKLIDSIQQETIIKKFYNKKITPNEFFLKIYNKEKGDTLLQEAITRFIEGKMAEILALMQEKKIFEMGSDGEPTWKPLSIAPKKASVLFHFMRNEDNTHYFPTIKYNGEKIDFQYKNAIIVCNSPAWLLVENTLYSFEKDVDGNKLRPFLNKKFIVIPQKMEETYYEKFVSPLIAAFDVHAKGFVINSEKYDPHPVLTFTEIAAKKATLSIFEKGKEEEDEEDDEAKIMF